MKCSTIGDLLLKADKAMDRRRSQMAKALGPDDEEHVADLGGGYSLVRLLTPAASISNPAACGTASATEPMTAGWRPAGDGTCPSATGRAARWRPWS